MRCRGLTFCSYRHSGHRHHSVQPTVSTFLHPCIALTLFPQRPFDAANTTCYLSQASLSMHNCSF
jgi:hypothetical protein